MNPSVSPDARRTVLVTGAASGIGAATARRFLREGWNVVINHLDGQQAEAQALAALASLATDAPGPRALCVAGDVTRDADCVRMVQAAVQACGSLHALVNAAGISKMVPHARLHDVSADDFQRIYAVNTVGTFQMIRAAAPALKGPQRLHPKPHRAAATQPRPAGPDGSGFTLASGSSGRRATFSTIDMAVK